MDTDKKSFLERLSMRMKDSFIGRLFWDKKFFNYTWIGILISLLNIFLLWLFIDVFNIPTVISSVIVIGATFIIRYVLYNVAKML
jgi:putative flippase GtrA